MSSEYKYKAFISYSHEDQKWASWLHRKIEQYKFPSRAMASGASGDVNPYLMRPIFKDREELSAGSDLGDKIESALSNSEALIVICSKSAAQSYWVNQEILFFKRQKRAAKIFSVIVDGEPLSGDENSCFPEALRFTVTADGVLSQTRAEPLAADLRESGDGRRLGLLKLLSGLADIGLDDLVQRDLKRSRQRVMTITLSAAAAVLTMGSITGYAFEARQEADHRRADAEEQIEFMLTDLKDEVKKVGRLDVLDIVIDQAANYYAKSTPTLRQHESYARLSRVNLSLGEISYEYAKTSDRNRDLLDTAEAYFKDAFDQAESLYARNSRHADYVFNYAQAAYWLGYLKFESNDSTCSRNYFDRYSKLAKTLSDLEPASLRGQSETIMAEVNLAVWREKYRKQPASIDEIGGFVEKFESVLADFPVDEKLIENLGAAYAWHADMFLGQPEAVMLRQKQFDLLNGAYQREPKNLNLLHQSLTAVAGLAKSLLALDQPIEAKKLLLNHLPASERLWRLNRSSQYYIDNFAYLNWYLAKASRALGETATADSAFATYQALKPPAPKNNNADPNAQRGQKSERVDLEKPVSQCPDFVTL